MKFLKSILSFLLALLVLVSASSFNVNMHFCGGHIQSVSLIDESDTCPMELQLPPCHKNMMKENGCCEDNHLTFEGKDFNYQANQLANLSPSFSGFIMNLPIIMEIVQVKESIQVSNYSPYKPPLVERDIPVLIQSFLI